MSDIKIIFYHDTREITFTLHLQKFFRSGNSDYALSFNVGNLALDFVKVGLGKDLAKVY
jgi:hypothetical protein